MTDNAVPGNAEPSRTVTFASSGGATLYGEWFVPATKPRALALVCHGYAEHCGRYREVANVLTAAGVATLTYDMRGHGRSSGKRGHIERFDDYLDDFDAALGQLDALASAAGAADLPRVLVAHSNGSLVALHAMISRRPAIKAAVISSPFLGLRLQVGALKRRAALLTSRFIPALAMSNELRIEDITSDPGKQAERRADTLCHDVATARWYTETIEGQQRVFDRASEIKVPTLWTVGGADPIADPARSKAVAGRLGTPAEYHELTGLLHEVFNERERGRVFGLVRTWLDRTLA